MIKRIIKEATEDIHKIVSDFAEYIEDNTAFTVSAVDGLFTFSAFSNAGQDVNLEFEFDGDFTELYDDIHDYYESYDTSYEAYLWLDDTGHGKNGAPYDMKDVYEDMESVAEDLIWGLCQAVFEYANKVAE